MAPTSVSNRLTQFRVADHVLYLEGFDANNLVLVNQFAGQLVEVVRAAIGDFGVNTRYLQLRLEPVLGAELLLGKPSLVFSQLGGVFSRVTGIAGFLTPARNEQVFNAKVDTDGVRIDAQQFGLEHAKAGHKVPTRTVLGNRYGARRGRKFPRPANVERLFALGNSESPLGVFERACGEFRRLARILRLEGRVLSPSRPKVLVSRLLMAKALLKRNGGNLIEICKLRELLNFCQSRIRFQVVNFVLVFVELFRAPIKDHVVYLSNTAKRPCQQDLLLRCRVEPIFVGTFD